MKTGTRRKEVEMIVHRSGARPIPMRAALGRAPESGSRSDLKISDESFVPMEVHPDPPSSGKPWRPDLCRVALVAGGVAAGAAAGALTGWTSAHTVLGGAVLATVATGVAFQAASPIPGVAIAGLLTGPLLAIAAHEIGPAAAPWATAALGGLWAMSTVAEATATPEERNSGAYLIKTDAESYRLFRLDPGEAARKGLRQGDVLVSIDGESPSCLRLDDTLLRDAGKAHTIRLLRGDRRIELRIPPEDR
ncbi:MAG: hypothetical protein HY319_32220 [Armatimonadetes bacterium]|nr:hypothetical protein [Armatimonadota bacterium]